MSCIENICIYLISWAAKKSLNSMDIFNENKLIWKDIKGATSKQGKEAVAALSSFGLI